MSTESPRSRKRILLIAAGALVGACALCSAVIVMFSDTTPPTETTETAEVADRSATIEIADIEPTDEPTNAPTPTDEPTAAPTEEPTVVPSPTPLPTDTPIPTATPPPPTATPVPLAAYPEITAVNKQAEYVDIRNNTGADVGMAGWMLVSEKGPQYCPLDGIGTFPAGATIRVFALARQTVPGEFSCGHESEIWNNSDPDPAVLLAPGGVEVSRR